MQSWRLPLAAGGSETATLRLLLCAESELPPLDDWLGRRESEGLARLRHPKRRRDWRMGRFAAKSAARAWLAGAAADTAADTAPETAPRTEATAIETLAAEDGAPELWLDDAPLPLSLSLSHRAGWALAAVGPAGLALGCDLEWIEPRSAAFVRDYFTPGERAAVEREREEDQPLVANLLWSAKECALKARRTGLREDTRAIEIDADRALGTGHRGRDMGQWHPLATASTGVVRLAGAWRREGDLLLTWLAGTI